MKSTFREQRAQKIVMLNLTLSEADLVDTEKDRNMYNLYIYIYVFKKDYQRYFYSHICHGMIGRRIGCQIGLLVIFHFIEKLITLHVPSNGLLNVYIQQLNKVRYLTVVQIFPFASTS